MKRFIAKRIDPETVGSRRNIVVGFAEGWSGMNADPGSCSLEVLTLVPWSAQ
jgi:hypothetical protein